MYEQTACTTGTLLKYFLPALLFSCRSYTQAPQVNDVKLSLCIGFWVYSIKCRYKGKVKQEGGREGVICVRKQVVLGTIYFVKRHRQFAVNKFRMLNIKETVQCDDSKDCFPI
jgi:hypothetical protein